MIASKKVADVAREILGLGQEVTFRSVTILSTSDRPIRIVAEMEIIENSTVDPVEEGSKAEAQEDAVIRRPLFIPLQNKAGVLAPKRKYTRKNAEATATKEPGSPKANNADRLDPSRPFTTSERN